MNLVKMTNVRTDLISSLLNLVDFETVLSVDKAQTKGINSNCNTKTEYMILHQQWYFQMNNLVFVVRKITGRHV